MVGSNSSTTTNLQVQEPNDVRIALNSSRYWQTSDGLIPGTNGYGLDKTLDSDADTDGGFCDEKYIDVKATDDDAPLLWGLLPLNPSPKSHAKAAIFQEDAAESILPFAVPEVVPGGVWAIFVDEGSGQIVGGPTKLGAKADPSLSEFSVYAGAAAQFGTGDGKEDVGVIIMLSRADVTNPDLSGTVADICGRVGVRCYSGGSTGSGVALINIYKSGGPTPAVRQTDVFGCNTGVNLSGPYFSRTGDCTVFVSAEIDFGSEVNPRATLHDNASCGGGGTAMNLSGGRWEASATLPDPSKFTGQVPFSISWRAQGSGPAKCFGRLVARPYVANGKSGPIDYLSLSATGSGLPPGANPYSIPKDAGTVTYEVTVGLRPPLIQSTLSDKAVLIRYATEDDPSLTQSIDCDVDNYPYPAPYDNMPADVAEIAYGCVTPYKVNPTLDCSAYGFGDLPPDAPPTTTFENAPDCAQSKNGQVSSLRKGLVARLNEPTCQPNNWPDPPITQPKIEQLVANFGSDPRLVTLVVTEFAAFAGTGSEIIPIRYFAGFYITGKDVSAQSPRCDDEDPHPLYGLGYKEKLDDGDVWGYFVVQVVYGSSGRAGKDPCDFTSQPRNCILTLVE
ncbi:MAG TPA: hypothetical protein VI409_11035 [Gaiellaceae bacterium]|nr:hypothetical protein [Gaiellaceae bacterium]